MRHEAHLGDDQLVAAAADPGSLGEREAAHLAECPRCGRSLEELRADLAGLERLARQAAPAAPPRPALLRPEPERPSPWAWRIPLAAGLAAAALIISVWMEPSRQEPPGASFAVLEEALDQDAGALLGPGFAEDDSLSDFQRFLVGEGQPDLDEEFMEFVTPFSQDKVSRLGKGDASC